MKSCYTVYVIYNSLREKTYTGYTSNLKSRLLRHNQCLPNKKSSYTSKNSGFWRLIYKEAFSNRKDAVLKEKWLKSGVGREFVKKKKEQFLSMA
jgi:putative endonuclease